MHITTIDCDDHKIFIDPLKHLLDEWKTFEILQISYSDFFKYEINSHVMIFIYFNELNDLNFSRSKKIKIKTMYYDVPLIAVLGKHIQDVNIQNFKEHGISKVIYEDKAKELPELIQSTLMPNGQLNVSHFEYIHAFEKGIATVFETACQMPLKRKNFYIKKDKSLFGYVSALMGITGETTGSVCLTAEKGIALKIIGHMLGTSYSNIDHHDIQDGMGEIVNMIAGQAKSHLRNTPYAFNLTIPSVIIGLGHEISTMKNATTFVSIFETEDAEELALQVTLVAD